MGGGGTLGEAEDTSLEWREVTTTRMSGAVKLERSERCQGVRQKGNGESQCFKDKEMYLLWSLTKIVEVIEQIRV